MEESLPKRELDLHQVQAMEFLHARVGRAGLFMAPGTGKTLVAVRFSQDLTPTLVICRRDDFLTWRLELAAEGIQESMIQLIDSGDADIDDYGMIGHDWYIVTYDLVKNPRIFRWVKEFPFAVVIADESHMIKRWASQRTKKVYRATRHIHRRIAMTGTPITNEPRDLFSQCLFIDDGRTFMSKEWWFLNKYYIREGHKWYLKRRMKPVIQEKLRHIAFHVHEDDVLKLPPARTVVKSIAMTGMQRRYYEQVLQEWELELQSGGTIEIDQVIVQLAKLRQIASGFYYTPQPNRHAVFLKCSKLDLLMNMAKDPDYLGNTPKVVVWAAHTAAIIRIKESLEEQGISAVTFMGRMSQKKREETRQQFRDDPHLRYFVAQVDSGVGMNELVVASDAVYYSNSHRVVSKQQSLRRTRRRGSERHQRITYWELVTERTVDVAMHKSIGLSMDLARMILEGLKRGVPVRQLVT